MLGRRDQSFFSTVEFEGPSTTTWRYFTDGGPEMFTFIERYYNQNKAAFTQL